LIKEKFTGGRANIKLTIGVESYILIKSYWCCHDVNVCITITCKTECAGDKSCMTIGPSEGGRVKSRFD